MSFSDYLERELLDLVLNKVTYTVTDVFVALWVGNPLEDGTGATDAAEVTGNDYARVNATGKWGTAAGEPTVVKNTAEITFPKATPSGWGTVTHFALYDNLTGGNMLMYSNLATAREVTPDSIPRFDIGTLKIHLD